MEVVKIYVDILIIGGGAAGCQAAIHAKTKNKELNVLIVDKANIKRSGCLAAGVNAINAYLTKGETPLSYVNYVKKDSAGLIREELTYTIGERLNEMARKLEIYGLPFMKDEKGDYVARGKRSVKINGENIKSILSDAVYQSGTKVLNKVNIIELITQNNKVIGALGLSIDGERFYVISSKAVVCSTGGASGIYKPNNGGFARHKMWYSPFNTGGGFAMGLRAGAEMTTFEMRFIALRTKDTLSPTGTIAQGVKSKHINANGEEYLKNYPNNSTPMRLYATLIENYEGRGPCYLDTRGISSETVANLKEAYLNMSPSILLKWSDDNLNPSTEPIEIIGSEPHIVGGHGQAGYWIDKNRGTTLSGLYAAGDVAGGSPKKYVTGAMAEGEIAVESAIKYIEDSFFVDISDKLIEKNLKNIEEIFSREKKLQIEGLEENMQKIMDEYAGGISQNYRMNKEKLLIARKKMKELNSIFNKSAIEKKEELVDYYELRDKILIARVLIEHLLYRKETRWRCYQERVDHPEIDNENWLKFINSQYHLSKDEIKIVERSFDKLGDEYVNRN